ncbi:hypothetical protein BKA81DRAFT_351622 [Phyllosticta paracitricarpa]
MRRDDAPGRAERRGWLAGWLAGCDARIAIALLPSAMPCAINTGAGIFFSHQRLGR